MLGYVKVAHDNVFGTTSGVLGHTQINAYHTCTENPLRDSLRVSLLFCVRLGSVSNLNRGHCRALRHKCCSMCVWIRICECEVFCSVRPFRDDRFSISVDFLYSLNPHRVYNDTGEIRYTLCENI